MSASVRVSLPTGQERSLPRYEAVGCALNETVVQEEVPGGSPFAEHDARNFITSEVRSLLSSRGSIRAIDSGRSLCDEPTNEFIEQTLVFRSSIRAVTNGNGNHSQAQDIDIPQRFCEQSWLSLLALPLPHCPAKQAVILQFVKAPPLPHTRSNLAMARMRHSTSSDSRTSRLAP